MGEKQLMILRHAEAGGRPPGAQDFERSLTPRGHRSARTLGDLLRRRDLMPGAVLCSGALRARETWIDLSDGADHEIPIAYDDGLFSAGPDGYLATLAGCEGEAQRLLLIAHNPSVTALARHLIGDQTDAPGQHRLIQGFRPCNLALISLPIAAWPDIAGAQGTLVHFFTETDLALG